MQKLSKEDKGMKFFLNIRALLIILIVLPIVSMQFERTSSLQILYIYIFYGFAIWVIIMTETYYIKKIFKTNEENKLIIFGIIRNLIISFMILLLVQIAASTVLDLIFYDYLHQDRIRELRGYLIVPVVLGAVTVLHYYEKLNFQLKIYWLGIKAREIDINFATSNMKKNELIDNFLNKKLSGLNTKVWSRIIKVVKMIRFALRPLFLLLIMSYMLLLLNLRPNTFFSYELFIMSIAISLTITIIAAVLFYCFEDKYMAHLNQTISKLKEELIDFKENKKYLETRNYRKYNIQIFGANTAIVILLNLWNGLGTAVDFFIRLLMATLAIQTVYYGFRWFFIKTKDEEKDN